MTENNYEVSGKKETEHIRESNIELFRILTMLLIIAHHYVVNSGLTSHISTLPFTWRSIFVYMAGAWGKIGINCFVMITGYFMCTSRITLRKFLKLIGEVMFYRIVIWLIFLFTGKETLSWPGIIWTLLPINSIGKNFTGCFLAFYLSIPFLNLLVSHMNQKQHQRLLLLLGFVYIALGTIHRVDINYFSWFIVLYFIASYLRLYPGEKWDKTGLWCGLLLGCVLLDAAPVILGAYLGRKMKQDMVYYFVADSNTILAVLTSISAFMFFSHLKIRYNKVINRIAASTFGVLLIHAHSDAMRQWLWVDVLDNVGWYSSKWMPLHLIGSVLCIYIICTMIDMIRIQLIEKPFIICLIAYRKR